ncbi:MAG: hypothetical protein AB7P20_11440 [Rhizobiaceae bacterium]
MQRTLQIVTVLLFIGIMTAIYRGTEWFAGWLDNPDLVKGIVIGAGGMGVIVLLLQWFESLSARKRGGGAE